MTGTLFIRNKEDLDYFISCRERDKTNCSILKQCPPSSYPCIIAYWEDENYWTRESSLEFEYVYPSDFPS